MPIQCPQCATENRDGDRFCRACGCKLDAAPPGASSARRRLTCRYCGATNKPSAHFCSACGTRLAAATGSASHPPASPSHPAAAPPAPAGARASSSRIAAVLAVGLLALALAGWYLLRGRPATPAAGKVSAALPAGASGPQLKVGLPAPPSLPAPVLEANAPAPGVAAPAEAPAPAAAERPAPDPAAAARARRAREAQRARAAAAAQREHLDAQQRQGAQAEAMPQRAEQERPRDPPPSVAASAPTDSVQTLCSARGNVISQQLCRNRECRKVEFAGDAVCVRLRELQDARQRSGGLP